MEQVGEKFDDALARVRRCVGGGTEANNADSDSDIEVVADSVSVNLRCPWQCPICLKNYSLENTIIDPYFNRITSLSKSCGDDTSEIDVKPDGSWRVKGRAELKDLTQWHLPDGTLCVSADTAAKPKMCIVKHEVKEEPYSEEVGWRLKLGIRKNSNGQWEISKRGDSDLVLSSDNYQARHMENKNCINLTFSTDDTDNADEVYNSEPAKNDYPMTHVHDLDSSTSDKNAPPPSMEQDVIVLSDSDDDAVTVLSPSTVKCGSAHDTGNLFAPNPPETSGACGEQLGGCPNETSFLALKEGFDDLGLSFWERPLSPRDDPTYQMFDPGTRVTDNPVEVDEPVHGGDLAVAANPLEDGRDGARCKLARLVKEMHA
ncbi:E3 SUMO-protein ligase SIZ2-like [Setaria viridis]